MVVSFYGRREFCNYSLFFFFLENKPTAKQKKKKEFRCAAGASVRSSDPTTWADTDQHPDCVEQLKAWEILAFLLLWFYSRLIGEPLERRAAHLPLQPLTLFLTCVERQSHLLELAETNSSSEEIQFRSRSQVWGCKDFTFLTRHNTPPEILNLKCDSLNAVGNWAHINTLFNTKLN